MMYTGKLKLLASLADAIHQQFTASMPNPYVRKEVKLFFTDEDLDYTVGKLSDPWLQTHMSGVIKACLIDPKNAGVDVIFSIEQINHFVKDIQEDKNIYSMILTVKYYIVQSIIPRSRTIH